MEPIYKLALETIEKNKQAIIFAPSRASAEKTAEDIAKLTNANLPELEYEILKAASTPTKQCRKLSHSVRKGIAFHHAGLLQKQKDLIEEEFKKGKIKIICATPTLAAGLSLPVFRVIIKSLKRYSGQRGMDWIPVLEYLQMAGRAGRPEYESFGEAICLARDEAEKEEIYEKYICGEPEDIYSKLAVEPVLRTYLLSLISSGVIYDEATMNEFFAHTFWAQQFQDLQKLGLITERMLSLLQEWGFVKISGGESDETDREKGREIKTDFVAASSLEKNKQRGTTGLKLNPTALGKRISELYLDPLTAKHLLNCLQNFNSTKTIKNKQGIKEIEQEFKHEINPEKDAFSLLQMICHTLELRPLLRVKIREQEFIQEELTKRCHSLLEEEPDVYDLDYEEFLDSFKTALFLEAWINEKDEDYLMEKFDIRPGEIRVKLEVADWLLYAAEELAALSNHKSAIKEIRKLRIRIKHGTKEELLPLLKLKGIGRIRARKLYSSGCKDLGDLKKADLTSLTQLLGKAIAEDVKKQVGEEIKEIASGKRTGQLSITKF